MRVRRLKEANTSCKNASYAASIDRYFEEYMKINRGTESTSRSLLDNFILSEDETREIRSVVLIIPNNKWYVVSFPKASFNIVLAIARTKALYMLARGMARGRVALQFLVMRLILDVYM